MIDKCKKHPKYKGIRKYTPYCRVCRKIFIEACHKRIGDALKDYFHFILKNPMEYQGLPRRNLIIDNLPKNNLMYPCDKNGIPIYDADIDAPKAVLK